MAQWLANRGYLGIQVNFRGSTGYGKRFLNAGNRKWGRAMHDDLIDAVRWVPENRLRLYAAIEAFLARHLGGRCEPE